MKQSDTTTVLPQMTRNKAKKQCECKECLAKRNKVKEQDTKPFMPFMNVRLIESDEQPKGVEQGGERPSRFRVVLIREGLGNLADGYYYPGVALEEAARTMLFEGKKIFANHPSPTEESEHPERTVQEILGHFENVKLNQDEQGRKILEADVVILPGEPFDYARSLMQHAIEYSKRYKNQDFIGLSINASGDAVAMPLDEIQNVPPGAKPKIVEAMQKGLKQVRYVKAITEAHSVDLVTSPGAGGGVLRFLETKGEGSRGGKVIGHTKSGKAIYASGNKGAKGWSKQDHQDAYAAHTSELTKLDGNGGPPIPIGKISFDQRQQVIDKYAADIDAAHAGRAYHGDKMRTAKESNGSQKENKKMDHKQEEEMKKLVKHTEEEGADKPEHKDDDGDDDAKKDKKEMLEDPDKKDDAKEEETKEEEGSKEEESPAPKDTATDDGEGEDHEDAAEDKALIAKMLKDVLGKDAIDASDSEKESVKEALKTAKEVYKDSPKEAMKAAGYHMKMSAHKAKMKQEESHKESDSTGGAAKSGTVPHAESNKSVKKAESFKESEDNNLKLTAEVARLKSELNKKLKESKLPNQATKLFREKAVAYKSKQELDDKFAIFSEAWNEAGKPMSFALIEAERVIPSNGQAASLSLSDCKKGD
jgi:hypothetical protein